MDDLPFNLLDRPKAGTIMDMLTPARISWVNYQLASGDQSEFRRFVRYRRRRTRYHVASLGVPLRKTATFSSGISSSRRPFTRSG